MIMNAIAERPGALMNFIERAAKDETFNLDKFRELILMQREAEQLSAKHDFNIAMSAVQSELQTVVRDRDNPHTRSRYATLQAIDASARPIYTRHGFSVRFGTAAAPWEGWVRVTCELAHIGGYSESHYLDGPLDVAGAQGKTTKTGIQAIGSTVSYLRRYLLLLILNLVTADDDDDDGEASRRAAAAAMPRAARVAERAPAYEAPKAPAAEGPHPLDEPDGRRWMDNLTQLLANAQSQDEVVEIAGHASVGNATAKAPEAVKRRLTEILANAYARFAEPDLSDEALGDVDALDFTKS
jgi:ERF superfamily